MRALRAEVNALLQETRTWRKPALRRCEETDAIFVTDLPMAAEEREVFSFMEKAEREGWKVKTVGERLFLDRIPLPPDGKKKGLTGESACCAFLLEHHAGENEAASEIREWLKAEETGKQDALCLRWHREWAEKLRVGMPLPGKALLNWIALEK